MEKAYTVCIIIGFAIPALTLLIGSLGDLFGGILHGMDLDFDPSIEIGNMHICLLPFSIQSICAGLLVFGAAGKMLYPKGGALIANIAGGVLAYLAAILIQTLIRRLKKEEHTTYDKEELLLFDAKVVNTIIEGGFGAISVTTFDGIRSSYPAKSETGQAIRQDTVVSILRFEKEVAIVKEKDPAARYKEDK